MSSYARRNRTKRALGEYDNIPRSIYLLDYIDSLTPCRKVQWALSRGEGYHQLRRAVSFANFGKLRFKTEQDQQIWNECARLITNCIIYYNLSLLSRLLEYKQQQGDMNVAQKLARISPVAWQHINFHGRYEFAKTPTAINFDALIAQLASWPLVLDDPD